jgi:hypothetical protein
MVAFRTIAALSILSCLAAAGPRIGAELTLAPISAGLCNILPKALSLWTGVDNAPAPIDSSGWPTTDAYLIFFEEEPSPLDPDAFVPPSLYGSYQLKWEGNATLVFGPQLVITVSNQTFDPVTFESSAVVTLEPTSPPHLAIGWFNSRRNASAPLNSGVSNVQVLAPGCWEGGGAVPFYHPRLLEALKPLSQIRVMEWTYINFGRTYSQGLVEWTDRTLLSDSLWQPGYTRNGSFGAPWETVVLLAQETGKDVWVNVPVYASSSYLLEWANLLLSGNAATGGVGVPASARIYVEHGNEVWLNGSAGGPGTNYQYNLDAAVAEVQAGGSNLNNDGATEPQVWAQRRHVRQLWTIAGVLESVFGRSSIGTRIFPVLGQYQEYASDTEAALSWLSATFNVQNLSSRIAGIAVNAYLVSYVPQGWSLADIYTSWLLISDQQRVFREAMLAVCAKWGNLSLLTYEGSPVGVPANGDNATSSLIIESNRKAPIASVMLYDYFVNWAPIGGSAWNHYALSSAYGPPPVFQWGLLEDLANTTGVVKYDAAEQEAEGTAPDWAVGGAGDREGIKRKLRERWHNMV